MKTNVIAALLGSAVAVQLNDAPPYFNEPTWGQNWPSAAGLVQLSACERFSGLGVSCGPADIELFATGITQHRLPLQHYHKLVLSLVIPAIRGTAVTLGYDALDSGAW